ncbi:MAG: TonB-dependent receptor plug domain-containing protein, partial [Bacteroidales bacterium]
MVLIVIGHALYAQSAVGLSGRVLDEHGKPVPGVVIVAAPSGEHTVTTAQGDFLLSGLLQGRITIKAQIIGYETHLDTLWMRSDISNHIIRLKPASYQLEAVTISGDAAERQRREISLNVSSVDREFMARNISTDVMGALGSMPGISSIEIGSGQSKPVIRGLGFNRVVVAESGIKHEAQQWGVDHGLEIDQFNIASAEVIKGPASLMYGSDAIGGVIDIKPFEIPIEEGATGEVLLTGRSNNNLLGTSAAVSLRKNKTFLILRLTGITHGDYRVPVNTVTYNTYDFVLKDHFLRNTAGREVNAFVAGGITGRKIISTVSIGNFHRRSGFYADAHGFEIRNSEIGYDASNRDIDLPYQQVDHLKVTSENTVIFDEHKLDIDLSYQNNLRQEFAEPVEHGYRPLPPDSLEREFNKDVFTAHVQMKHLFSEMHKMTSGVNLEYQHNRIGGWGFIIPAFRRLTAGAFVVDKYRLSEKLMLNSGIRMD